MSSLIEVRRYDSLQRDTWNQFIGGSKNATFIFDRNFMDYHSDRYSDHSLMVFSEGKLCAVMPVNEKGNELESHGGLSYGGLLLESDVHLEQALSFFHHSMKYFHEKGFSNLLYKCIPSYLHTVPSNEDQYALFRMKASIVRRDVSCVYSRRQPLPFRSTRMNTVRKGLDKGYQIRRADNPEQFWRVLETNLKKRHDTTPVHSLAEITTLCKRFPKHIQCFEIHDKEFLGGTIIFDTKTTAHAQYISATDEGRRAGALDVLFEGLITTTFTNRDFFSFGMSNEEQGKVLNLGLNGWKEGFGARVFPLDFYAVDVANFDLLSEYA